MKTKIWTDFQICISAPLNQPSCGIKKRFIFYKGTRFESSSCIAAFFMILVFGALQVFFVILIMGIMLKNTCKTAKNLCLPSIFFRAMGIHFPQNGESEFQ